MELAQEYFPSTVENTMNNNILSHFAFSMKNEDSTLSQCSMASEIKDRLLSSSSSSSSSSFTWCGNTALDYSTSSKWVNDTCLNTIATPSPQNQKSTQAKDIKEGITTTYPLTTSSNPPTTTTTTTSSQRKGPGHLPKTDTQNNTVPIENDQLSSSSSLSSPPSSKEHSPFAPFADVTFLHHWPTTIVLFIQSKTRRKKHVQSRNLILLFVYMLHPIMYTYFFLFNKKKKAICIINLFDCTCFRKYNFK
ncbi:hypothetical protein RFI_11275 [Reticulomyxa filosa]|uniref:Uncharacterized protein n=1 Tax=Reticulomyxa filosa TaxID=46433 RepID=X6NIS3_RETFI|nr:hypothetical protein RFI_11275 [Reticulomyxa filosa]|eukprot:ETO25861.1 hypothetical protein RFI_11275 [Reticulomyxa filosa]